VAELQDDISEYKKKSTETDNDFIARGNAANYDQKLDNISKQLEEALDALEKNANANGYYAKKNNRPPRQAPVKLWSVGMTASKTEAVNKKMIKVAQDAIKLGSDPVYGPYIMEQQAFLADDIEAAFTSYDKKLQYKYNTEPKFKAYADKIKGSSTELGNELGD
jgi:hypothetical protein